MSVRWTWLDWPAGLRWVLTAAYFALVNWLLFTPSRTFRNVPLFFPQEDKIAHLAIFGTLAALIRWSMPDRWVKGWRGGAFIVVLAAYGASTECIQALIPHSTRLFEWGDIAMDFTGVVLGMVICGWFRK